MSNFTQTESLDSRELAVGKGLNTSENHNTLG